MKIALTCSHGGHFTEILRLMDAFEGHDIYFITYESSRTSKMSHKRYLFKDIGMNPIRLLFSIPRILKILTRERTDLIVSTGSEIAIPTVLLGKLLGIETIFIESICRVDDLSCTGKIIYKFTDLFLVQWEELAKRYEDAEYWGSII